MQCNGYGDAPKPGRTWDWEYVACGGCAACARLPRCNACGNTARNGRGECLTHIDLRQAYETARAADADATLRAAYAYILPSGDLGIDYADEGRWRSYNVDADVAENTLRAFFDAVQVSEIDQDGGELACYGFADAPADVQDAVCRAAGISDADAAAYA